MTVELSQMGGGQSKGQANIVALFGDSITALNVTSAGIGASSGCYFMSSGYWSWAQVLLMQKMWLPVVFDCTTSTIVLNYCKGVGGNTTVDMLARLGDILSLNPKPGYCCVLAGTNDITELPGDSAVTVANRLLSIINQIKAAGITPIVITLLPRGFGTTNGWGSLNGNAAAIGLARGRLMQVNQWLREYCRNTPGIVLVDPFWKLCNPASAASEPLPGYVETTSYVHPTTQMAFIIGQEIANVMSPLLRNAPDTYSGSGDNWNATNNIYGSYFDGELYGNAGTASTGVTGTVATNWTAGRFAYSQGGQAGTNATGVATQQARADGGNGYEQKLALTGSTQDTNGAMFRFYNGSSQVSSGASGYVKGDSIVFESEFTWTNNTAGGNPSLYVKEGNGTNGNIPAIEALYNPNDAYTNTLNFLSGGTITGVLRTPIFRTHSNSLDLTAWTLAPVVANTAATVTQSLRRLSMRTINPNMPGAIF